MKPVKTIDVKNAFYFFIILIKNAFLKVFYFLNVFYFLVATYLYSTKPPKLLHDKTAFNLWI